MLEPNLRVIALGEADARLEVLRARGALVTACDPERADRALEGAFELALIGRGAVDLKRCLDLAARALVPGGGLLVTRSVRHSSLTRAGFGGVREFATLRNEEHPKYLVPLHHHGAAVHFFHTVAQQRAGTVDRGIVRIASALTRLGLLELIAPGQHILATKLPPKGGDELETLALVEPWLRKESAAIVGPTRARSLHFTFITGWRDDGTTLTALGFEARAREPSFVVKVATGASIEGAAVLRNNLEILGRAFEAAHAGVPRLLHTADRPGASAVFESVVQGRPVRVPGRSRALRALAFRVCRWLLELHRRTGPAPTMLDETTTERLLVRPFERYLARFRPGADEASYLESMSAQARLLAARPFPLVLAHGDFCPPNLVDRGCELGVLDWELPLVPALPAQDLIHFLASIAGYEGYEKTFFSRGPRARIARDVLAAYATALGIGPGTLAPLFTIFWLEYAVEKAEVEEASRATGEQPWGLARLARGTCLNVERLARARGELFLRMR